MSEKIPANNDPRERPTLEDLLSVEQAAKFLNLSPATVRKYQNLHLLRFAKLGTRVLFRRSDLMDFVESRLVEPIGGR